MKKIDVVMPKMGESITEGKILKWLKQPGDKVEKDETLLEISTDKVDTEVPSPVSGILVEILVPENEVVEVDTKIARIETSEEEIDGSGGGDENSRDRSPRAADTSSLPEVSSGADDNGAKEEILAHTAPSRGPQAVKARFYSPVVLRIATTEGISMDELASIEGTGINGRVTKKDVLKYLERRAAGDVAPGESTRRVGASASETPPIALGAGVTFSDGQDVEIIEMDNVRQLIAEHMVRSVHTSPHAAMFSEVDMTLVEKIRERHGEDFQREGFSLTYMPFVADAVVRAIKDFPLINSSVDGTKILVKRRINLGIATALSDGGLIVPVVKDADSLSLAGLARSIVDLSRRARRKQLKPEEIQGGTFTITNFGVFGNLFGFPIINQPEAAILGIGSVVKRAVVVDMDGSDVIAIRPMMYLSLSIDHRVIDGALGGMFLERVAKYLGEGPASLT
ncbi:MAG: 2-oxo acid dehydrogenase subunit E2 [Chlorobi bacterium]|nr:2-oxo acid dehydrogenase subunit E2 [Chlorobiota bacterium]